MGPEGKRPYTNWNGDMPVVLWGISLYANNNKEDGDPNRTHVLEHSYLTCPSTCGSTFHGTHTFRMPWSRKTW
ncbi:hypothetical protein TNCV_3238201 [Trichonephila clavipes]|nr:hypothetical protein TNCV_3238201 [Trichonephila clavipes]